LTEKGLTRTLAGLLGGGQIACPDRYRRSQNAQPVKPRWHSNETSSKATERKATAAKATDSRFRREYRLADKSSFSRVFDKAKRSRDKMFTVLYRSNGSDKPRLGLAISQKNCRLATGRNRLKRIVRESFRQHRDELDGLDFVVLNQPIAARADNKALFDSLEQHWQRCRKPVAVKAGKD
jgi:ribonuclease P protein component